MMKSYRLFKRVVNDIVTEKDGISFDNTKILASIGTLIFFGLTIFTVIKDPHTFNYVNWGIAFASILGATAAGVKIKADTEQPISGGGTEQVQEKVQ
jgi:hypothetical protein